MIIVAVSCCSCTSPSAPSEVQTLYELRLVESPICPILTAGTPSARYGFFKFGTVTVHVRGSFSGGTFLLVDDNLAVFAPQCPPPISPIPGALQTRPTLHLESPSATNASVSGRFDGVWFPSGCPGNYLGAEGTVSGTRDATSASGLLNGNLSNGIFALNFYGWCPATDHAWSLKPAQ
jgi:hypothetical protein